MAPTSAVCHVSHPHHGWIVFYSASGEVGGKLDHGGRGENSIARKCRQFIAVMKLFACLRPSAREPDAPGEHEEKQLDSNADERRAFNEKLKAAKREARDAELTIETLHDQVEDLQEQLRQSKEREQVALQQASRVAPTSPTSEVSEVKQDNETAQSFETPMHTPLSQTPAGTPARPGSVPPGPTKQQLEQIEQTLSQIQRTAMEKQLALEAENLKAKALIDELTVERDAAKNKLLASIDSADAASALFKAAQQEIQEEADKRIKGLTLMLEEREAQVVSLSAKLQDVANKEEQTTPIVFRVEINETLPPPPSPPPPSPDPNATIAAEEKAATLALSISRLMIELEALKASHSEEAIRLNESLVQLESENALLKTRNAELDLACNELNRKIVEVVARHEELDAAHAELVVKHSLIESTRDDEVLDVQASHAALQSMYDEQQSRLREIEPELLEVKFAHEDLTAQHADLRVAFEGASARAKVAEEEKSQLEGLLKEATALAQKKTEELNEANRVAIAASTSAATAGLEAHGAREELRAATTRYEAEKQGLEGDLRDTKALLEASALREKLLVAEVAEVGPVLSLGPILIGHTPPSQPSLTPP